MEGRGAASMLTATQDAHRFLTTNEQGGWPSETLTEATQSTGYVNSVCKLCVLSKHSLMSRLKISNPATTDMKVTEQLLLSMWREKAGMKGHRVNWRSLPPQYITFFHKSRIMTQGCAFRSSHKTLTHLFGKQPQQSTLKLMPSKSTCSSAAA